MNPPSIATDGTREFGGPDLRPLAPLHFPWLETITLARLRLQFEVKEPIVTGPFPENRVRSSLGVHLRRLEVCAAIPDLDCDRCFMTDRCQWFSLFGVPSRTESRPYCLDLVLPGTRGGKTGTDVGLLAPGSSVGLDLTLFGAAAQQPERLVAAFSHPEAGGALFGGTVRLKETLVLEPDGTTSRYRVGMPLRKPLTAWLEQPRRRGLEESRRWRMALYSPLSAKLHHEGLLRDGNDLTFPDLVRLAVRRTVKLAEDFGGFGGPDSPGVDFQPLEEAAQDVRVSAHSLEWLDRTRRSARQDQRMALGGLVGWLELEGTLAPFTPLMMAAELCHLGKRATFGFGGVEVTPLPGDNAIG